ncbi:MAG: phage/plasmid primase, P4 family, partial [Candidatus Krumholzibacteria bacterium]|nr:phage/plasmid primase, P4 family [Candidatus Krumholzibacteria bacterium]
LFDLALATSGADFRALAAHARATASASRIAAMLDLARSEPGIPIDAESLDADPWLLTVENGTLDLRNGTLRAHAPADFITKRVPHRLDYPADLKSACPRWLQFLAEVLPDAETRDFVQRAVGYSLTGDTREQCLLLLCGSGSNGKSTFIETLLDVAGDFGLRTPSETLLARRGDAIPNDVAALRGARLVVASETEDGRRLAESRLKELTGGDTISARYMRAEWFQFRPTCKLWLSTNHRPQVRGTDHAIWRRIRLIPFEQRFGNGGLPADPGLRDKLREELPGILAWAVRGAALWLKFGLTPPASVTAATSTYRSEQDALGEFLDEATEPDPTATITAAEIFGAYKAWCEAGIERPMSKRALGLALQERGFEQAKTMTARLWRGLALRAP